MDRIILYAKPSATNVNPYAFYASNFSILQQKTAFVHVKNPFYLRNVYLSASDINLYNGLAYSYFDPFSGIDHLKDINPGFTATVVPNFTLIGNSQIVFDIPQEFFDYVKQKDPSIPYGSYIDVIVENEAGYGLLSRDSYSYPISSWSGFYIEQKPCINGILISNTST
jgi:hypothetical protein